MSGARSGGTANRDATRRRTGSRSTPNTWRSTPARSNATSRPGTSDEGILRSPDHHGAGAVGRAEDHPRHAHRRLGQPARRGRAARAGQRRDPPDHLDPHAAAHRADAGALHPGGERHLAGARRLGDARLHAQRAGRRHPRLDRGGTHELARVCVPRGGRRRVRRARAARPDDSRPPRGVRDRGPLSDVPRGGTARRRLGGDALARAGGARRGMAVRRRHRDLLRLPLPTRAHRRARLRRRDALGRARIPGRLAGAGGGRVARLTPRERWLLVAAAALYAAVIIPVGVRRGGDLVAHFAEADDWLRGLPLYASAPRLGIWWPPFATLLVVPFAAVAHASAAVAKGAWAAASVACIGWSVVAVPRERWRPVLLAVAAVAVPLNRNFEDLNLNAILLALVVAAAADLERGRETRSGAWIGAATALKVFPGLLLVYLAYRRRWRAAAAGAAVAAACTIGALLPYGVHGALHAVGRW